MNRVLFHSTKNERFPPFSPSHYLVFLVINPILYHFYLKDTSNSRRGGIQNRLNVLYYIYYTVDGL